MAFIDTVKQWFKTGLIPTEAQFYSAFGWLRWKDELIPIQDIEEIEEILNEKADQEALTNHLSDTAAHPNLLEISRIIPYGQVLTFKTTPDGNQEAKEPGDFCLGYVDGLFIAGLYVAPGDYDTKNELEL